jgi:hypothetical protein
MRKLKTFESHTQKTYIAIEEVNGWEGEEWTTYLVEQGNDAFIQKLKSALKKYPNFDYNDTFVKITEEHVPENEVNIMVKRKKVGYMDSHMKCDEILDPKRINDSTEEDLVESIYKGKLFD